MRILTFILGFLLAAGASAQQAPVTRNSVTTNALPQAEALIGAGHALIWNATAKFWSNGIATATATNAIAAINGGTSNQQYLVIFHGAATASNLVGIATLTGAGGGTNAFHIPTANLTNSGILTSNLWFIINQVATNATVTNLVGSGISPAATNNSYFIASSSGRGTNTTITGAFQVTNANVLFGLLGGPAGTWTNNYPAVFRENVVIADDGSSTKGGLDVWNLSVGNVSAVTSNSLTFGTNLSKWVQVTERLRLGLATVDTGLGSPESTITANVGSIFLQTNAANTTAFWIKTNGMGNNTGWWLLAGGGGAATTPGGNTANVQFNESGAFAGTNLFSYNRASNILTLSGVNGSVLHEGFTITNAAGTTTNTMFAYGMETKNASSGLLLGANGKYLLLNITGDLAPLSIGQSLGGMHGFLRFDTNFSRYVDTTNLIVRGTVANPPGVGRFLTGSDSAGSAVWSDSLSVNGFGSALFTNSLTINTVSNGMSGALGRVMVGGTNAWWYVDATTNVLLVASNLINDAVYYIIGNRPNTSELLISNTTAIRWNTDLGTAGTFNTNTTIMAFMVNSKTGQTNGWVVAGTELATAQSIYARSGAGNGAPAWVQSTANGQVVIRDSSGNVVFGAVDLADTDAVTGLLGRANLPSQIAYEDEANTFTLNQAFSGPFTRTATTFAASQIDFSGSSLQFTNLTANITITFANLADGRENHLVFQQDATGTRTVTWPAMTWVNATNQTLAPQVNTNASGYTHVLLRRVNGVTFGWMSAPDPIPLNDMANITGWTKGDILVWNGTALTRLAVGANNTLLTADSAQATGLKWQAGGAGTPGGSSGDIQYNNAGSFGGTSDIQLSSANRQIYFPHHSPAFGQGIVVGRTSTTSNIFNGAGIIGQGAFGFSLYPSFVGDPTAPNAPNYVWLTNAFYFDGSSIGYNADSGAFTAQWRTNWTGYLTASNVQAGGISFPATTYTKGLTNITLQCPVGETYVMATNVIEIKALMQYSPGYVYYPAVTITNGTGGNVPLVFNMVTNRIRFQGVYGTNAPSVLTNNTTLQMSFRCDGTNTLCGYSYFAWP